MRGLLSKYTVTFIIFVSLLWIGNMWTGTLAAPPFDSTSVTIAKPGIVKFDWTSGNLDYKGVNINSDAADGDTDWIIYKYTWVSSNPTVVQQRTGSWTLRATYF